MILVLLFVSGALALVYEVLWLRRFALVLGATAPATAATLSAVLLGLTLGSLILGRMNRGRMHPLRLFALLEVGVGLGAVAAELALRWCERLGDLGGGWLARVPGGEPVLQFLLPVLILMPATICMGGTVPVLGAWRSAATGRLGLGTGGLYAANTAGAALGAVSVPFFWLPTLGASASLAACVGGSLLVALMALIWSGWSRVPAEGEAAGTAITEGGVIGDGPGWVGVLGLSALSGLLMLSLEVAWGRMFAQVHEHSIYSFAVVLGVFLVGLAAGSGVARELLRRGWGAARVIAWGWVSGGVVTAATPGVFFQMTGGLNYLEGGQGWGAYGLRVLGLSVPTVLLPAFLGGMVMPAVMELCRGRGRGEGADADAGAGVRVDRARLGGVLGVNTLGSMVGSLVAAFVLPGWVGLWWSISGAGLVMVVAGLVVGKRWAGLRWGSVTGWVAAVCVVVWVVSPGSTPRVRIAAANGEKLVFLEEGSHGIAGVVESRSGLRIKLDNYYILGGTASTGDERMQGHLPLLLHPAPKRVAYLGLGTGIMAGASLLHPVEQVVAVELVPEVFRAAAGPFREANLGFVSAPRVSVRVEDARRYLKTVSPGGFDVVIGDLVVPWRRGEAALYFADHFEAARRALAPGGVFCQWLPLFQLSEAEFNIITATFLDVFPHATLWRGDFAPDRPAVALIGQLDGTPIDPEVVERRVAELKPDLSNPHLVHPAGVWMYLGGRLDPAEQRFAGARRNRADQPWVEILGPRTHGGVGGRTTPLFIGQELNRFLAGLRAKPTEGTVLGKLGSREQRWMEAGGNIADGAVLLREGRGAAGEAAMELGGVLLPPAVRRAVLGR